MVRNNKIFIMVLLVILALPRAGLALEGEEEQVYELEEIVVKGELERAPGVISQEEIAKTRTSRTADGLLENLPGIDLKRRSPGGDVGSAVSIRGLDESRCLIMLDGRPLNGAGVYGGDYIDWSSLSSEDIERIEVTRGARSVEYGNTLGGVINIVTKKGEKQLKTELRSSYGHYDTREYMHSHSGGLKFLSHSISSGHWQTDGYLRNNNVDRDNFAGRLRFSLPAGLNLGLGARYTIHKRGFIVENKETSPYYDDSYPESDESSGGGPYLLWWGNPGPFGPPDPEKDWGDGSYWKNIRGQYDLELNKSFGSLDLKVQAYLNDQDRTEYFYAIDDKDKLVLERFSEPENTWGWLLKAFQPVKKHNLGYGIEGAYLGYGGQEIKYADDTYFRVPPSSSAGAEEETRRHSLFAQDNWAVRPYLGLNFGLRYDHYNAREAQDVKRQGLSPKLGINYKAWEGGTIAGSFGQVYRFPTSPESYWYFAGHQLEERKALSPERAIQAEVGISQDYEKRATASLRGYYYNVDDYIRTIFGYQPSRVVYNIDQVEFWGVEAEGEASLRWGFSLFANYTFQTTKKQGDILDMSSALTDKLTELPEHKVNAGVRYRRKNGTTADLTARYVGKRSVIIGDLTTPGEPELVDLDGFLTFGLTAAYPVLKRARFTGAIRLGLENIFAEDYEEIHGFPMPPRTITGGLDITF
jgi:outer membrane receptor protein involved in Fe transport